jgi:glycosyltransferase involved in cell wall biosynthesis
VCCTFRKIRKEQVVRLKICLVSTEPLPTPPTGYWGGIESVVYDLANALYELGHDVTLVARPGSKSPGKLFPTFKNDAPISLEIPKHFQFYSRFVKNFDGIIHDHSHGKMARLIHPNVIQTLHSMEPPRVTGYKRIVAISYFQAKWLERLFPFPRDIPVVHHGVDLKRFKYKETKGDRFLYFSRIATIKGAKVALNIARETGIKIDFAGIDGDATNAVRHCKLPNVKYYGQVSNEQRTKMLANAKAVIFPTGAFGQSEYIEAFGLVMIESLASGTPVIAANNGAAPEVIDHGKVGYVCRSEAEMIEAIKRIEDINPENCIKHVEKSFSHKVMALKYVKLYERVLKGELWPAMLLPLWFLDDRFLRLYGNPRVFMKKVIKKTNKSISNRMRARRVTLYY